MNFVNVFKVCVYYNCFVIVFFIVVVNIGNRYYVWIFMGSVFCFIGRFFILVKNMIYKRRNEENFCFCVGVSLCKVK